MGTPQWFSCDLVAPIVTLDASKELDIVAAGSLDGTVALRVISTGRFLHLVRVHDLVKVPGCELRLARLSFRGYLVLVMCGGGSGEEGQDDTIVVLTVNGELVSTRKAEGSINALAMSEDGFSMVTGGSTGKLLLYDILDLSTKSILEMLDGGMNNVEGTLKEFLDVGTCITAMELSPLEGCQQLMIGTNRGDIYSYRYSPRIIGQRIAFQ